MSNRQIKVVMALFLLGVVTPNIVWAKHPSMALTPLEQAGRLSNLANQTVTGKPFYQHNYRSAWMSASLSDRVRLAERIGTQGATRYAMARGLVESLGSRGRSILQGPDFVYLDPFYNRVRVIEAKGGSSQPKWTYGSRQGTNTNAIRSAKFVLKSAKASQAEKRTAALIIKAAQKNRLETGVVKTPHVLGKPESPRLKGWWNRKDVSKEAFRIERELRRNNPNLAKVFKGADAGQRVASLKHFATKAMRIGLPFVVGLEVWRVGTASHEYALGRISQSEFYRISIGSATVAAFTVGGGIVAGIPGASLGAGVALLVQIAGDWVLNQDSQKFDDDQIRLMNAAVYEHYEP